MLIHLIFMLWVFIMLVNYPHTGEDRGFYPDSQFVPVHIFISAEETYY